MEILFIIAILSTIVFVLLKIVEMKYLEEEMKPLKFIIKDAVMVFSSALAAGFFAFYMRSSVTELLNIVTENKVLNNDTTQVFTDSPGF